MSEIVKTIVFGYNSEKELPEVLYCGNYSLRDALYELAADKEQNFDSFTEKDGKIYDMADELVATQEEAKSHYIKMFYLAGKYMTYELIPVRNLGDVGNERFLEAVKRIADKFPFYKDIAECYHLIFQ